MKLLQSLIPDLIFICHFFSKWIKFRWPRWLYTQYAVFNILSFVPNRWILATLMEAPHSAMQVPKVLTQLQDYYWVLGLRRTFPPLHEATLVSPTFSSSSRADLERSENQFGTALHIACLKGYDSCMRVLLHAGANPDVIKRHQSPLHIAAARGRVECACLLLQYGANVYKTDGQGRMAVDLIGDSVCRRLLLATAGKLKSCLLCWEY